MKEKTIGKLLLIVLLQLLTLSSCDADNIDDVIIASGFHSKEDVYLNVPE